MFIKLFKSGYSLQLIILFVILLLLWIEDFINPVHAAHEFSPAPFYNYFYYFQKNLPILQVLIAFILVIAQAFLLNKILIENAIIRKNSFLPAFVYIIIMSQSKELHTIYPALIANLLLIVVFYYLLKIYNETEAYLEILNAGFLVGLASLFYLPSIFFIILLWIGFIIYSIFLWREWVISLIGLLIPYIFLFTYYFWFDRMDDMLSNYLVFFDNISELFFELNIFQIITLSMIALFVLLAINRIIISLNTKTISIRKKSIIMIWFFLISLISLIFGSRSNIGYLALTFVPCASLIAYYFSDIKKKVVIEVLFVILILLIFSSRFVRYA